MYRITIEKITKEKRVDQVWRKLTDNDQVESQYGYVDANIEEEVVEKIYEQLLEDVSVSGIARVINEPILVNLSNKNQDETKDIK
jgi:hypothetical protein